MAEKPALKCSECFTVVKLLTHFFLRQKIHVLKPFFCKYINTSETNCITYSFSSTWELRYFLEGEFEVLLTSVIFNQITIATFLGRSISRCSCCVICVPELSSFLRLPSKPKVTKSEELRQWDVAKFMRHINLHWVFKDTKDIPKTLCILRIKINAKIYVIYQWKRK